jgi:hypothetical protein
MKLESKNVKITQERALPKTPMMPLKERLIDSLAWLVLSRI